MSTAATIFALSSAPGRAAIAVIRISGPGAGAALDAVTRKRPEPRKAAFRRLHEPGTGPRIDDALVLWLPGPNTETGEDMAELHVHGGRAVIAAALAALGRVPALRPARPGEFTRRAFDNGRIDLTTAEGIADLVDAETEEQRRQAYLKASGEVSVELEGWRQRIIEALGYAEAAIDFADEGDVADSAFNEARAIGMSLLAKVRRHLDGGHRGEILRDGFQVTIAGPPNVGKSSLLNAMARRDVAIVSEEAGTTRDVLEVSLDLGGYPIVVTDTAGIREAEGAIEREGIRRALARTRAADLVLWMSEAGSPVTPDPDALGTRPEQLLEVASKSDLLGSGGAAKLRQSHPSRLAISAKSGDGIVELIGVLQDRAANAIGGGDAFVTSARQRHEVETINTALGRFVEMDGGHLELAAEELRLAATAIGRLSGRIDAEHVLDQVFARFCIGK